MPQARGTWAARSRTCQGACSQKRPSHKTSTARDWHSASCPHAAQPTALRPSYVLSVAGARACNVCSPPDELGGAGGGCQCVVAAQRVANQHHTLLSAHHLSDEVCGVKRGSGGSSWVMPKAAPDTQGGAGCQLQRETRSAPGAGVQGRRARCRAAAWLLLAQVLPAPAPHPAPAPPLPSAPAIWSVHSVYPLYSTKGLLLQPKPAGSRKGDSRWDPLNMQPPASSKCRCAASSACSPCCTGRSSRARANMPHMRGAPGCSFETACGCNSARVPGQCTHAHPPTLPLTQAVNGIHSAALGQLGHVVTPVVHTAINTRCC